MADLQRIQFKRTNTSGSAPAAGVLAEGELALNLKDRCVYSKDSGGNIVNLSNPLKHDGDQDRWGQLRLLTAYDSQSDKAQIFHDVRGSAGVAANIRSMREHVSAAWLWEQVVNGRLLYSTGKTPSATKVEIDAANGRIAASGEIVSRNVNGFRIAHATKRGVIFHNNGDRFHFLTTATGQAAGDFNSLRPFEINLENGVVTMSQGAIVNGGFTSGGVATIRGGVVSEGTIRYYNPSAGKGLIMSGNNAGYSELVHMPSGDVNAAQWGSGLRCYGGTDWRIGAQKLYGQHYKPSVSELGFTGMMVGEPKSLGTEDLDTIQTVGVYAQHANANTSSERHYPENAAGSLIVTGGAGVQQRYHVYNSSRVYTRAKYSTGAWTQWAREYNTLNKPSADELNVVSNDRLVGDSSRWADIINKIPYVHSNGVLSIGKYIDFHDVNSTKDFDVRLNVNGNVGSEHVAIQTVNGSVEIGARNSTFAHIYTDRPQFAFNKPIITLSGNPEFREMNTLIMQGGGRKHIRFQDSDTDGYIWKDPGQSWHINHGNKANSDMMWTPNGELITDGARWAATHAHGYASQPNTYAPIHVNFGNVAGASDYYPIVRGVTVASGYGYTTAVDLGMLRQGGGVWGQAILRVASHESANHPQANYSFSIEGDFTAPRNGNFNDVYIRSDSRLKINLERFENASDKLRQLTVYTYDKLEKLGSDRVVGREIGIIAQDLRKIVKEAVNVSNDEDQLHTISNSGVNAVLIKAVQEILDRLDAAGI